MILRINRRCLVDLALIAALILAVTLPFLSRAFHLDDNQFIRIARNILHNPWRPFSEPTVNIYAEGLPEVELEKFHKGFYTFQTWVHPPLQPYFIALVAYLSGGIFERPQHLAYLLLSLLAAGSAYFLARRFTASPRWAVFFLILSPAFILSAHSVMSDMPMLAFYHTALLGYVYGIDRQSRGWLALAGVSLALAMLTRYAAFTIIPVLVTYAWLRRARLSQSALPFIIAALLFATWEWWNFIQYQKPHLLSATSVAIRLSPTGSDYTQFGFLTRNIAFLIQAGSMLVFPLHLLVALLSGRRLLLYGIVVCLSLLGWLMNPGGIFNGYSMGQLALLLLFFSIGLFAVYRVIESGLSGLLTRQAETVQPDRDRIFLSVWFSAVLVGSILGLPFATARYLLPLALPLIIIVINQARDHLLSPAGFRFFSASGIAAMSALSLNMAYADYVHARVYKEFTHYFSNTYKTKQRVWFIGEYGFYYYMEAQGYSILPFDFRDPTEGDLLVRAQVAALYDAPKDLYARAHPVGSLSYAVNTPLRLFDRELKAGYYSHGWGFLPFYFSRRAIERFDVFRITDTDFFIRTLEYAKLDSQRPVSVMNWTINGESRTVLHEHPPARLTYSLTVPEAAALAFGIALSPEAWDREGRGDGVLFEVSIVADGTPTLLFSRYIDPKNRPDDRQWHDVAIDLSSYAGKSVSLIFATSSGPSGDERYDWAGWGGLRWIAGESRHKEQK